MLDSDFDQAAVIIKKLQNNGHEAYIVGGAVRDFILGKTVKDVDIATSASPEKVRALFVKTIPVGVKHGTIVVRYRHRSYEVTTFRKEADYKDYRRPTTVSFVSSLHEDLKRRDFTMNAMAMSIEGQIIDLFSGRDDIASGVIRTVGQPMERFQEDPLRMMRAVRFTSQLSFRVEDHTRKALEHLASYLRHISIERIRDEFEKLLLGNDTGHAFFVLTDSGLYSYLPGMAEKREELKQVSAIDLSQLSKLNERLALVCFILNIEEPATWLRNWKLSNRNVSEIANIVQTLNAISNENWTPLRLYEVGKDTACSSERIRSLLNKERPETRLQEIEEINKQLAIKQKGDLKVSGDDLLEWFEQKPGPWISKYLKEVEKAVILGEIVNEKGTIRKWLLKRNR